MYSALFYLCSNWNTLKKKLHPTLTLDSWLQNGLFFFAFQERVFNRKNSHAENTVFYLRGGSTGGARGAHPLPPEMTYCFLIQLYKICYILWCVFSAVHIILLPSQKLSSSYSALNFAYVTSQLRGHSFVVQLLQRKILNPNLNLNLFGGA